jgi:hypothetical protein
LFNVHKILVLVQIKSTAKAAGKRFKMVIYQRDLSRKLANQAEAVADLQAALGDTWDIQVRTYRVVHGETCDLYVQLNAVMLVRFWFWW